MCETVISVENLSKRYIIGRQRTKGDGLRHVLQDAALAPLRWLRGRGNGFQSSRREEFWALKDVAFDVEEGDAVGIIGPNGAGKSTLLKILSRITEPTSGRIRIKGPSRQPPGGRNRISSGTHGSRKHFLEWGHPGNDADRDQTEV